jgi:hypothetical protein
MKIYIHILFTFFSCLLIAQDGKKVQFVGGARSILSNSDFSSKEKDTVTVGKTTGGYALIDLGIKINPNPKTEILGMFRINNAFGGFWGSDVTFGVRQLYVKGIAGKGIRYQLGNIDYKLSPYTCYNSNSDLILPSFGTTSIKEQIINYESFYKANTWRQQGAAVDFVLNINKRSDELKFKGFLFRLNPSNQTILFERLYGGGSIVLNQHKNFHIGANYASVFDVRETALNNDVYRNQVATLVYDYKHEFEKLNIELSGESGYSNTYSAEQTIPHLKDYFIHFKANTTLKKAGLQFEASYIDNGADFRSAGAQSKRIDFNQQNTYYQRYTNNQIVRPLSYYDLYNDPALYSMQFSTKLMEYSPAINNVLPYGVATFNRRGVNFSINYKDKKERISMDLKYYRLGEIRGQGTMALRKFDYFVGSVNLNPSAVFHWKKSQTVFLAVASQNTKRTSQSTIESLNLQSYTLNFGISCEIIDKLYLLGNTFLFKSDGNEILPVRDTKGVIVNFQPTKISGNEYCLSSGLKFEFSKDVYLSVFYEYNVNNFVAFKPYNFNQFQVIYFMKF